MAQANRQTRCLIIDLLANKRSSSIGLIFREELDKGESMIPLLVGKWIQNKQALDTMSTRHNAL